MIFLFRREDAFYPLSIDLDGKTPELVAEENARANPGTISVESASGKILWQEVTHEPS